jgi:hypothetical protein
MKPITVKEAKRLELTPVTIQLPLKLTDWCIDLINDINQSSDRNAHLVQAKKKIGSKYFKRIEVWAKRNYIVSEDCINKKGD